VLAGGHQGGYLASLNKFLRGANTSPEWKHGLVPLPKLDCNIHAKQVAKTERIIITIIYFDYRSFFTRWL
jgi:hypothetical protein